MKHMIIFVILLFIFYSNINSQNIISFGIRDEIGITNIKICKSRNIDLFFIPIQNLYITIDLNISEKSSLQLRPGYIKTKNNYSGWELGGYWNYKFSDTKFYSTIGLNFHFNSDNIGGNSGGVGNTIRLVGLGVGYITSDRISFEVSYQHPIEENYGLFLSKTEHLEHYIINIIKFGISIKILD